MRSIRVERRLDARPEAVFEVIADHGRYDRFAQIRRSELVQWGDPAPNGVGAVRWIWVGPLRFEEEITAFEPARRLDFVIREVRAFPLRHEGTSITFAPAGAGTHVVWASSFEVPVPLIGSALERIISAWLARGFGSVLERSVELSGQSTSSPASSAQRKQRDVR